MPRATGRVAIVGPGAVGGVLAGAFAEGGCDVSLLGRPGPHLDAIAGEGLRLRSPGSGEEVHHRLPVACDAGELPLPDFAVVCVKGQDLPAVVQGLRQWIDDGVDLLVVANSVPWWLLPTVDGFAGDPVVRSVDPGGDVLRRLPPERVMAGVAHFSSAIDGPGRVVHVSGTELLVGEPVGGVSERVRRWTLALSAGPVHLTSVEDIRQAMWEKLLGNINLNPVSALTSATVEEILGCPEVRQLCVAMFDEAAAVGAALGIKTAMTAGQRFEIAARLGAFRTSMLQDAARGRPLELEAIVGAMRELARRTGVPCPSLDAVYGLLSLRERVRDTASG
jgi:2-dehydropantoate 2-reductase